MTTPNYDSFGRDVWEWIKRRGADIFQDEDSEVLMPMAQKAGLVQRVIYDPEKHGFVEEVEPGDFIWWWKNEEGPEVKP